MMASHRINHCTAFPRNYIPAEGLTHLLSVTLKETLAALFSLRQQLRKVVADFQYWQDLLEAQQEMAGETNSFLCPLFDINVPCYLPPFPGRHITELFSLSLSSLFCTSTNSVRNANHLLPLLGWGCNPERPSPQARVYTETDLLKTERIA